ncbi:hypothetical protein RN001_010792 [Aquatica leii]|uniref:PNT domain-containing protein n=1 Tax=Aquatica leii TaxID=1421715 RepID=A0AAN7PAE0_9COLE|nr:hypothetical protein RN001_010792 [Aquatica leii]
MAMQITESIVEYGLNSDWYSSSKRRQAQIDRLPKDPRQWSKDDVVEWLKVVTKQHGLPEIPVARFSMNGKALCLMSPHMFLTRVPLGGKLLYKDFQLRLCAALYSIK